MGFINMPEMPMMIITSLVIFSIYWLLCYWLYKKRIFFKL
jgi:hypothetical protein